MMSRQIEIQRIVHAEMPGTEETSHGLQLWVNLPRKLKGIHPDYQSVASDEVPERREGSVRVRAVAGEESTVALHTAVRYLDLALDPEAVFAYQIPLGWNGLICVLEGRVAVVDAQVDRGDAGIFEGGRGAGHVR
ncbi:MAG: hypothetical protein U9R72_06330 [Chloroflexota bacterium]|nr:hypothetical protein [Chloroflexota bacterium]